MCFIRLRSCGCLGSLNIGAVIIFLLESLYITPAIIISVLYCVHFYEKNALNVSLDNNNLLLGLAWSVIVVGLLELICLISMLIGIFHENKKCILPWLGFVVINLGEAIVATAILSYVFGNLFVALISLIVFTGVKLYFSVVIYNCYLEIDESWIYPPLLRRNYRYLDM